MSNAMSRDNLVIAVNRLMICAMEDVDCGRDEAGPTTLDLVERIERHDRALRSENERLREALRYYADPQTYGLNGGLWNRIAEDAGRKARAALKEVGR